MSILFKKRKTASISKIVGILFFTVFFFYTSSVIAKNCRCKGFPNDISCPDGYRLDAMPRAKLPGHCVYDPYVGAQCSVLWKIVCKKVGGNQNHTYYTSSFMPCSVCETVGGGDDGNPLPWPNWY